MSRSTRVAMTVAAAVFLASGGCGAPPGKEARPEPEEARAIPLKEVYSTNGQEGLRRVTKSKDEPYARDLQEIRQRVDFGGLNVILVRGKDITAAVKATRRVFTAGGAADVPVGPGDGSEGGPLWLAAFLGIDGSGPHPAWLVRSVERKGNTVRLNYLKTKRDETTKDGHHYIAWVPLSELKAGAYGLELFDTDKKVVTLMRRVTVPAK